MNVINRFPIKDCLTLFYILDAIDIDVHATLHYYP